MERSGAKATQWRGPRMGEFVALMAALMACNALAIDSMLPALPAIGNALGLTNDNERQLVITAYLLGFGISQLIYGPLSDRFGRKPILVGGLIFYCIFAVGAGLASSFEMMLGARAMQGSAAAVTRVLTVSIIRDRFHGAAMAKLMSTVFIVFMIVPVLAPFFGQAVLAFATWRFIFFSLAIYCGVVGMWMAIRLPETLPIERRRPLAPRKVISAIVETLTHRLSIGNTVALTLIQGALFGFINSIQQITFDVFNQPEMIGFVFAGIAGPMAASSFLNTRIVHRYGSRTIMLRALAVFATCAALHFILVFLNGETLVQFVVLQALTMASFGLIAANLGSVAMEPMGHIAGTASSVQGVISTSGGALIGLAIGQSFNGTTIPFLFGFTMCSLLALALAIWTNRPEKPVSETWKD